MSTSLFSLPVASWQQPSSSRAANSSRKRKRKLPGSIPEKVDAINTSNHQPSSHAPRQSYVITPDEIEQYKFAGQPLSEERPGGNFPHVPSKSHDREAENACRIQRNVFNLPKSPDAGSNSIPQRRLRQQHLGVMTAILHRSVQKEDFVRAGRALGMILRDDIQGRPVDIRSQGKWGIGAEILMRRDAQIRRQQDRRSTSWNAEEGVSHEHLGENDDHGDSWLTRKGFEDAKAYFKSLTVQYPYHAPNADSINAFDFQLAMLGLWIYVVHEEWKASQRIPQGDNLSVASDDSNSDIENISEPHDFPHQQKSKRVPSKTLNEAHQIAQHLDGLMVAPPYTDHKETIKLRGMVALWIADLCSEHLEIGDSDDSEHPADHGSVDALADSVAGDSLNLDNNRARHPAFQEYTASKRIADHMFNKLRAKGGAVVGEPSIDGSAMSP